MELTIHPLTPERLDDYLYFFDGDAFHDNPDWAGCYCTFYCFDDSMAGEVTADGAAGLRLRAIELINAGELNGYLAYSGGRVVGWCCAGDKGSFARIKTDSELWHEGEPKKIKSIVCYVISPAHRRQGVATALLDRVCADAAAQGYDRVESYPFVSAPHGIHYHGHEEMYERAGFDTVLETEHCRIMAKTI